MELRKLSVQEYRDNLNKTYLEECLENGSAEFYIVNYKNKKYEFWFYKNGDTVDIALNEKGKNSLFDYEDATNEILEFLKNKGFKTVKISLADYAFCKRKEKALLYGFKVEGKVEQNGLTFINYFKNI